MTSPNNQGLVTAAAEMADAKAATDRVAEVLERATSQLGEILSDTEAGGSHE